jgi:hypothetical protein
MTAKRRRLRPLVGLVAVLTIALGWVATPPRADALSAWDGSINLYRSGVFTTQKSWLWCTAAGVQIIRNIVDHREDHTRANQQRYFDYMRKHNRYSLPVSAGVDPAGWTAGLRHYVDDRYRLIATETFRGALRLAVTRMRKTNLPVALTVSHGNHGWVLHGFAATADPAKSSDFTVTSVRVTGPLWGLQNSSFGYDMRPNTKLTPSQLQKFFTKWWYAPKRMVWDGKYVSIQPVTPRSTSTSTTTKDRAAAEYDAAAATAEPSASPSAEPTSEPTATPTSDPSATPSPTAAAFGPVEAKPPDGYEPLLLAMLGFGALIVTLVVAAGRRAPPLRRVGPGP